MKFVKSWHSPIVLEFLKNCNVFGLHCDKYEIFDYINKDVAIL